MDLSRLASIHKSINCWEEELRATQALGQEERQIFVKKLTDLKELLTSVWLAGKIGPEEANRINNGVRELDRLFDECRLLG